MQYTTVHEKAQAFLEIFVSGSPDLGAGAGLRQKGGGGTMQESGDAAKQTRLEIRRKIDGFGKICYHIL